VPYPTGSGHARTFSNRYGIIGKVWRTETAIWADDLFNPQTAHEERADVTSSGAEIPGSEEKIIIAAPGLQILQLIEDVGSSMPTVREKEISAVMKDWGMNRREAETALKHRSYFCCPLVHDNIKVGLLFMDSTRKSAFKADGRNDVLKAADEALAPIIHKIIDDLSGVAIQIEFDA
jgi:hypothetical protein